MAEDALRRHLVSAFDPGPDFPSRTLVSRTMASLQGEAAPLRRRAPKLQLQWLLPIVAALLVIATVATLLLAGQLLHDIRPIPVRPGPGGVPCSRSEQGPFPATPGGSLGPGPLPPAPAVMVGTSIAWAGGGLRTTDGGLEWANVLPATIYADVSKLDLASGWYPPGYAEFYLDGNHAWALRTYSSGLRCDDRFAVFLTADGGRTWQQSAPVTIDVPPPGHGLSGAGNPRTALPTIQIYFANQSIGWVWIPFGPPSKAMGGGYEAVEGFLYGTSNGGLDWRLISTVDSGSLGTAPPACRSTVTSRGSLGTIRFLDDAMGWLSVTCASPEVLVTRDGGKTWALQPLPAAALLPPTYFDRRRGLLSTDLGIYSTTDGGTTWRGPLAPMPVSDQTPAAMYFASPTELWMVESAFYSNVSWVYRSVDGGLTWSQVSSGIAVQWVIAIAFSDSSDGMMLGLSTPGIQPKGSQASPSTAPLTSSYVVLITHDGGRTWQTIVPKVGLPS